MEKILVIVEEKQGSEVLSFEDNCVRHGPGLIYHINVHCEKHFLSKSRAMRGL